MTGIQSRSAVGGLEFSLLLGVYQQIQLGHEHVHTQCWHQNQSNEVPLQQNTVPQLQSNLSLQALNDVRQDQD